MSKDATILPLLFLGGVKSWENPQLTGLNKLPAARDAHAVPHRDRCADAGARTVAVVHEPGRPVGVQDRAPARGGHLGCS